MVGGVVEECAAHSMLQRDQRALDGLCSPVTSWSTYTKKSGQNCQVDAQPAPTQSAHDGAIKFVAVGP
jgi:hypothetical protein